jgi:hypothetical protein
MKIVKLFLVVALIVLTVFSAIFLFAGGVFPQSVAYGIIFTLCLILVALFIL